VAEGEQFARREAAGEVVDRGAPDQGVVDVEERRSRQVGDGDRHVEGGGSGRRLTGVLGVLGPVVTAPWPQSTHETRLTSIGGSRARRVATFAQRMSAGQIRASERTARYWSALIAPAFLPITSAVSATDRPWRKRSTTHSRCSVPSSRTAENS